jgi:hypothetical protein
METMERMFPHDADESPAITNWDGLKHPQHGSHGQRCLGNHAEDEDHADDVYGHADLKMESAAH